MPCSSDQNRRYAHSMAAHVVLTGIRNCPECWVVERGLFHA